MLVQIHPVGASRSQILALAMHFLLESAEKYGTAPPGFSEDAATFLSSRQWDAKDLAVRVARAVAGNQGSLITADDLSEP
jgi:DNA-binding NtrC family response regulator